MENQKISIGRVQKATIEVNNLDDENRTRDITATVDVDSNGNVNSVSSGLVNEVGNNTQLANFSQYGDNLNLNFFKTTERCETMEAVETFISDIKNNNFNINNI